MRSTYTSYIKAVDFSVNRAASLAIRNMLEATHKAAQPNTPREYGDLKDNVVKSVQGTSGTITWMQPYALVQEKGSIGGKKITNYTTPGTGPKYAENAVREVSKDSDKYFGEAIRSAPRTSSQQGGI